MATTANLGYPRIGPGRELKRLVEAYWAGELSTAGLEEGARSLRVLRWQAQRQAGIDHIPSNDFSLYDHVLDTAVLVGATPARFRGPDGRADLGALFAMARGGGPRALAPLPMTKWFDTNYHYIVPEIGPATTFHLAGSKPFDEFREAAALGVHTRPVLLGPVSFLLLARSGAAPDPLAAHLAPLLEVYAEVIRQLVSAGADWIQLDEPCLVQDRSLAELAAIRRACEFIARAAPGARLMLQTYFGDVGAAYPLLADLPVAGLGLDFVAGRRNLELVRRHGFPAGKVLSAGVVDGRNVWVNDLEQSLGVLEALAEHVDPERLVVAPSCSLLHVPLDREREQALDPELRSWLAFACQKLDETVLLARALNQGRGAVAAELDANRRLHRARGASARTHAADVRRRLGRIDLGRDGRRAPWSERARRQRVRLGLPSLPTTVIGSFPQGRELRAARRRYREGTLSRPDYESVVRAEIARAVATQDAAGIDVPAHGEFERADMVEYFAESFDGFAFTTHGWVQSYGTRCVKPPILYGDVRRGAPVTVRWWRYAQSLTRRPLKGMLTGPVTMLQWSFVRDDQPRRESCLQLALAIRDEALDLERAGAAVIQVDEPALREGLPLRAEGRPDYLAWAVECFRLATGGLAPATQLHTHMCYARFGDIMDAIAGLDADVLLIESARAGDVVLEEFRGHRYPRAVGPGVWDIHSPRVPAIGEIAARLRAALRVLDPERLWVTPDCGLKTRTYAEVEPALRNLVAAARTVRALTGPGARPAPVPAPASWPA